MTVCRNFSKYTIKTHYGTFYVCQKCVSNHPLSYEYRANGRNTQYTAHPENEIRQCQCEYVNHTSKWTLDKLGVEYFGKLGSK